MPQKKYQVKIGGGGRGELLCQVTAENPTLKAAVCQSCYRGVLEPGGSDST